MKSLFLSVTIACLLVSPLHAQCEGGRCSGDNNADGMVTIDELIESVGVALDGCSPDTCQAPFEVPEEVEFRYTGDAGPGFWGDLREEWVSCATDTRQSPIDITAPVVDPALVPLDLSLHETPIELVNNGHTIEEEYEAGSSLLFEGVEYGLLQFHFHTLSEHAVDGDRGVMELHAVFRNADSGNLAVIGMLYNVGDENEFLGRFDEDLPIRKGDHVSDEERTLDLSEGLTDTSVYYTYAGSLTTPPCSPIVTWIVLKERAQLSAEQFAAFRDIMGNNFRPLQARNDRTVRTTPSQVEGGEM